MGSHFLISLKQSSSDIRLLWFTAFIRMMSYGLTNQVLTLYLKELGLKESQIGIFMTLTMIGDTIISYFLVWNSNKIGNRGVMLIGCFLMFAAGAVFSSGTDNFVYLLLAAIFGVISPSGNETGPFRSIEEAVLAKLTPPNHRSEIYAVYYVFAGCGSSLGSLSCGFFIQYLVDKLNFPYLKAYKTAFYIFCAISILKFISMLFLSYKCEPSYIANYDTKPPSSIATTAHVESEPLLSRSQSSESSLSLQPSHSTANSEERRTTIIRSTIEHQTITGLSKETQDILIKLLVSFTLDSFGYGFLPPAWAVYYFKYRYAIPAALLGVLFATSDVISSISAIPSALIVQHLGPIKASVFTQIPCGLFFMAIPMLGYNLRIAVVFWYLYQFTAAIDVVPRQILLSTIMHYDDLPKVMGTVNISKQAARTISPYFTGVLAEHGYLWVCFIISASCLIFANLILAYNFRGVDEEYKQKRKVNHDIEQ